MFEPQFRAFYLLIILSSGSDSAPHTLLAKRGGVDGRSKPPAGVYTQSFVTQYVILALEEAIERCIVSEDEVTQERLEQFLGGFGRQFYRLPDPGNQKIILERKSEKIPYSIKNEDVSIELALSRAGDYIFSLRWKTSK